ncbi:nucleolar protein 10 [Plakobranchus ocellatus]|uniref:Nucleolar protein 10 n=1 Tax=Plakobranchus ocellatus TaxID=259542 RepID=A0AAV3Z1R5_9GAST|nr:nucleolar protein 10 [Plakobranchus ocellatus]
MLWYVKDWSGRVANQQELFVDKDNNTVLLAEKAVVNLRTPKLYEVKALGIPHAIGDVIVGNVEGARSPEDDLVEDPDMSVMEDRNQNWLISSRPTSATLPISRKRNIGEQRRAELTEQIGKDKANQELSTHPPTQMILITNICQSNIKELVMALSQFKPKQATSPVYDDYKFVTRTELESLGLGHLIGTNLLRSVMHGFFLDIRLYHKAQSLADPFAFEKYRKSKIKQKMEENRTNRVKLQKLPSVNRELAMKLMDEEEARKANSNKRENKAVSSLLKDDRFSAMFTNPDFEIDPESEEFRLINPVMSKLDKARQKRAEKHAIAKQFTQVHSEEIQEPEGKPSDEEGSGSSSDDEHTWKDEIRREHKKLKREKKMREVAEAREERRQARLFQITDGEEFGVKSDMRKKKDSNKSLANRLQDVENSGVNQAVGSIGNREMTFSLKKEKKLSKSVQQRNFHQSERRKVKRAGGSLLSKPKSKHWMGNKIK